MEGLKIMDPKCFSEKTMKGKEIARAMREAIKVGDVIRDTTHAEVDQMRSRILMI